MGRCILHGAAGRGAGAPLGAGAVRGRAARAAPRGAPHAQLRGYTVKLSRRTSHPPPAAQTSPTSSL